MAGSLRASGDRLRRIPGTGWMYTKANKKYKEDIQLLHDLADKVSRVDHVCFLYPTILITFFSVGERAKRQPREE